MKRLLFLFFLSFTLKPYAQELFFSKPINSQNLPSGQAYDKSNNYLSTSSMLICTILNNSREEYISLSQEINTLHQYTEQEQIRFANPFKFVIEIDEEPEREMVSRYRSKYNYPI